MLKPIKQALSINISYRRHQSIWVMAITNIKKNVFAMLWGTDLEGYFEFYFVMPSAIAQHRL